jgi:hypothetical protein
MGRASGERVVRRDACGFEVESGIVLLGGGTLTPPPAYMSVKVAMVGEECRRERLGSASAQGRPTWSDCRARLGCWVRAVSQSERRRVSSASVSELSAI